MTTAVLCPLAIQKFWANDGTPLAYGKVYTYQAGSTTPTATYTDSTGGTSNANPITLNARGECQIWTLPNVLIKINVTDSLGNQISGYPVDQVGSQFLLTLFAGVDTGSPNAYIVNYSAPYTSYTQGNPVIYFIASNSNTGPSTINVNSLGIVSIVNPNFTPLSAGQIVAGQMAQIVWQSGQFILTSVGATTGLQIGTFGAEASIIAGNVTDLGSSGTHTVNVTGSSTITSFGTSASINAPIFAVRFSGAPLLTYNATSLITPTFANIQVTAGDAMLAEYLGSGNWKILLYQSVAALSSSAVRTTQGTTTSSTVIAQDTQLKLSLNTTGTYAIYGWINDAGGTSAGGLKGEIAYTGSMGAGYWSSNGVGTSVTTVPLTAIGTSAQMQSAQTGTASMPLIGMIQATSTGTLSFSWAQQGSSATPSVVSQGSFLEAVLLTNMAGSQIPVTHTYLLSGTAVETIPTGFTTMTVEIWGGTGGGSDATPGVPGGGGASGAYSKTTISVSGLGGQNINYTVGNQGGPAGNGAASIVSSGTFAITTMTANGGNGATGNTGGTGNSATGGTVTNTSGNSGTNGPVGTGGAGIVGTYATGYNGSPGFAGVPGTSGSPGIVLFHYA